MCELNHTDRNPCIDQKILFQIKERDAGLSWSQPDASFPLFLFLIFFFKLLLVIFN
jgi:hypothetical protein